MAPSVTTPGVPAESWAELQPRLNLPTRDATLEFVVRLSAHIPGSIVEFGVADGQSTRRIRATLDDQIRAGVADRGKKVYACDSFKGLPEKYENAEVGAFACDPPRIRGVELVVGYYQDSLTPDLADRVGKVSFASLDADLYSSTLCALRWLTPLLQTGTLLLFDEFVGENESEKRAFEDWSAESGVPTVLVAEFLREPSGWGAKLDRRALYQVVLPDPVRPRPRPRPRAGPVAWAVRVGRRIGGRVKRLFK